MEEINLNEIAWIELQPTQPNYFFAPKDFDLATEYNQGWSIADIFPVNSTGVKTHRDHFVIDFDLEQLRKRIEDFRNLSIPDEYISNVYNLRDTRDWKIAAKRTSLTNNSDWKNYFTTCLYRLFDIRFYYHHQDVVELTRHEIMRNLQFKNLALILCRQQKEIGFQHCFVSDKIGDGNSISINSREISYYFPLYIYPHTEKAQKNLFLERTPNLSPEFLTAIKAKLGYTPTPEQVFYYAYAIFHSFIYRSRYAEFLKIEFPRLPLTSNDELFNSLSTKGEELVNLHLLKSEKSDTLITTYENQGDNQITEVTYNSQLQRVSINKQSYFAGITQTIWDFKIGGYQVL